MKTFAAISTAFLFLVVTSVAPNLCAQEHENERNGAKSVPEQDNRRPTEVNPQQNHDRDHSASQEPRSDQERENQGRRTEQQPSREPQAGRPGQEQNQHAPQVQHEERHPVQTQHDERRPVQAQRGKRIPDDRFRAEFGPSHRFRVGREQIINNPQPVVVYGGYTFELVEPWPADWSYDDDCYIDYVDDQYYLFNPFHPGIRIALIVVDTD